MLWLEGGWSSEGSGFDAESYLARCPVNRHVLETDHPFFWTKTGEPGHEAYRIVRRPSGPGIHGLQVPVFRLVVDRLLYSRPGMAGLPAFIQAVHDRDATAAQALVGRAARSFAAMSLGLTPAVECRNRAHWRAPDQAGDAFPLVSAFAGEDCADWSPLGPPVLIGRDAAVPTLILSGEADPITPPVFAQEATAILGGRSRVVDFAHVGHGAADSTPCGERVVTAFIQTATTGIDAACAALIPPVTFR